MKTWKNCNRILFLLPHLGQGQTPKEHIFCQTSGLGVDFVFAKNGQSLRNRVAEPPQRMAEPPQPEPLTKLAEVDLCR